MIRPVLRVTVLVVVALVLFTGPAFLLGLGYCVGVLVGMVCMTVWFLFGLEHDRKQGEPVAPDWT